MAELKQVIPREVGELWLDPENPRLPLSVDTTDQGALLRFFDDHYNLDELAVSMGQMGYFGEEPMLTVPAGDGEHHIVVEGNRRLATLKLLLDEEARASVDRTEQWEAFAHDAEQRRDELDPVPTFEYETRNELLEYLGFRHVTGVAPWTAEAKARYVTSLIESGLSFVDTARAIGSRQDAVRRQYVAYAALKQAAGAGESVDLAQRFFGVFYRATQSPGIRRYMKLLEPSEIAEDVREPIEAGAEPRVGDVSAFLFGNPLTEERPVITDSRQLTGLGRILDNPDAAGVLRETRDFSLALDVAGGDRASIETALTRARSSLITARGHAFEFVGDGEIIERAQGVDRVLQSVLEILSEPPADGDGSEDAQADKG